MSVGEQLVAGARGPAGAGPCPLAPGLLEMGRGVDKVPNHCFPQSILRAPGPGFHREHRGVSGCSQLHGDGAKIQLNLIWGNHQPNPSGWQASFSLAGTHNGEGSSGFSSGQALG